MVSHLLNWGPHVVGNSEKVGNKVPVFYGLEKVGNCVAKLARIGKCKLTHSVIFNHKIQKNIYYIRSC